MKATMSLARRRRCGRSHEINACAVALAVLAITALLAPATTLAGGFNTPGNLLIADQGNNRVIELNDSGRIVWHFGTGVPATGPHTIVAPQAVERIPYFGRTLVVCGSVPPGTPGYPAEGVLDNRVLIVNRYGRIVWQYGTAGVAGSGPGQLDHPVDAMWLPNDDILIVDQGNQRVIEVSREKRIVWKYGTTGVAGSGSNQLDHPASVELSFYHVIHFVIADEGNDRVIEVTRDKKITWSYGGAQEPGLLSGPISARLLPSGSVMIVDAGHSRVFRVTRTKRVTWTYVTNTRPGSVAQPFPSDAWRRLNGDTVISDGLNQQVIEVARDGMMVWSYGTLTVPGLQWGQLSSPRRINVVVGVRVYSAPVRVHGSG